jgi:hypothetical protein
MTSVVDTGPTGRVTAATLAGSGTNIPFGMEQTIVFGSPFNGQVSQCRCDAACCSGLMECVVYGWFE